MSNAIKMPIPSQHQLRAELEAMVLGDLLGPAGGESEELTERTVRDRYLVACWPPADPPMPPASPLSMRKRTKRFR